MGNVANFLKGSDKKKVEPSKHSLSVIRNLALKAHEIDSSKTVVHYYCLFLDKYVKRDELREKTIFFGDDVIEV